MKMNWEQLKSLLDLQTIDKFDEDFFVERFATKPNTLLCLYFKDGTMFSNYIERVGNNVLFHHVDRVGRDDPKVIVIDNDWMELDVQVGVFKLVTD